MRDKIYHLLASLFIFALFAIPYSVSAQTTGSIGGTVSDADGPLIGASVRIEGTSLGAVTDETGSYVILNVEAGRTYDVTASYVGYENQTVTGVRVSVDQRTEQNFTLSISGGIVTEDITIEAERRGIDVEQSGRLIDQEQIQNTGIRGVTNIVAKTSGVVQDERGTSINIRGGRTDENIIIVDGVTTTNPIDGTSSAFVPNSLLSEIAVFTGGFGAEYGNVLSGVINVITKSGTDTYTGSMEAITDEFAGDWINTTSQGYNLYNISVGGPLIPSKSLARVINFFGGVEKQFLQVSNPSWIGEELFDNGVIPNFTTNILSYNAKLNINLSDLKNGPPLNFRFGINSTDDHSRQFVQSYYKNNSFRNPLLITKDRQMYGRLSHTVTNNFFYELQGNYYSTKSENGDPLLGGNWYAYGDTNSIPGLTLQGSRMGEDPSTGNVFFLANRVNNSYIKEDVSYWGAKLDATLALLTKKAGDHEIKWGGEYKNHTLRYLQLSPVALADPTGLDPFQLYYGREVLLKTYGYEVTTPDGVSIVTGNDLEAKNPIIASGYIRDKIDFGDFTVNAGLRMDYLDVNDEVIRDINDLNGPDGTPFTSDDFVQSSATVEFSPRLGFSFPVTDRTVFVANYGRFIQLPQLRLMYIPRAYFEKYFSNSVQNVIENSSLEPEKLTSYEVGFKHQVSDIVNLGITAFYKETRDQIGTNRVVGPPVNPNVPGGFAYYDNTDFSISRGLEFYLSMRRFQRATVDIAYTLSYSSGVGSDPFTKFSLANTADGQFPKFLFPTDFDQRHTGSINVDYRFGSTDVPKGFGGEILKNMGLNLLFSFNSGRPYTRRELPKTGFSEGDLALSSKNAIYSDWNTRLDLKLDKGINIWKTNLNLYVYVINLLNTELVNNVYGATGLPGDNGYLNTPTGAAASELYKANFYDRIRDITNWGPPRQIRFGARLTF